MTAPLLRLEELAAEARSSGTVVKVMLSGPEGMGRTWTLNEFFSRASAAGFLVFSVPLSQGPAPAALLHAMCPALPDGDAATLVKHLAAAPELAGRDDEGRQLAAELLVSLLGVVDASFKTAGLDPESRREGALAELGRWLAQLATRAPLVLGFDDVQAADGDSLALLDFLAHLGDGLPLLLVATADVEPAYALPHAHERLKAWESEPGWHHLGLTKSAIFGPGGGPAERGAARVQVVKALGTHAFELAGWLATFSDGFPPAALTAAGVEDAQACAALERAGVLIRVGRGETARLRFVELRTRLALASQVSPDVAARVRAAVAQWARARLEDVGPVDFRRVAALVPLAVPALDEQEASLWTEAHAALLSDRARVLDALSAAAMLATGVRRLVLLRRVADLQMLAGRPEQALETLKSVGRTPVPVSSIPGSPAGRVVAEWVRAPLDRWHTMVPEAAAIAVELTRAEALSHLAKKVETQTAFSDVERRLQRLSGGAAAWLWARWAKGWTWFLCEVLRRPLDAVKACETVRKAVAPELLAEGELALSLVRAEEVAASSSGDFSRAKTRVEEHLRLAQGAGNLRESCLAWNARAIIHFGNGELAEARRAFEKAVEQARSTGWLRREAISTHNLALVLTELGAWDEADAAEHRYAKLSVVIGNQAGSAEAPAVLAGVALGRGQIKEAQAAAAQALKSAESNGWHMLLAWARVLSGRLKVLDFVSSRDPVLLARAKNDLSAALTTLEELSTAWTEELDPGEVFALFAAVQKLGGQTAAAKETVARAERLLPKENVVSHRALAVGKAFVDGQGLSEALSWFDSRGYVRVLGWWRALAG